MSKILDMPELENVEHMKRKDIVSIIRNNYISPNQATNTRLEMALSKGRKVDSLIKWLERVDKFVECATEECSGSKIGDEIGFVVTKCVSGGYSMTQKYGRVFAISGQTAIVTNGAGLHRISLIKQER